MTMIPLTTTLETRGPVAGLLPAIRRWLADGQARRARRLTLLTLLQMDPHRLDDMGIDVAELREALHDGHRR